MMTTQTDTARAILIGNDRGGYTVPTARLYPFQWNWDSAFVAMGFATFDTDRAWQEIESLLRGQWQDGLVPQIVFHAPSDDYFPGPDVWQIDRTPPTSGITQPPVLATACRHVLMVAGSNQSARARMADIYPHLVRYHDWWARARDPHATGLVSTLHPWETGMDNSPAWDAAMARVPTTTTTAIRRRDTSHIDPSMRPRAEDYQRFIHLVDCYRDAAWDPARMFAVAPFRVADIGTNAILLRAERDLLALAQEFGTPADRDAIAARIARAQTQIGKLWNAELGLFCSLDQISGQAIPVPTSAGFLPIYGGAATPEQATAMADTLARWMEAAPHLVPSTAPDFPGFEPLRYWRGPIWAVVNWMIANGMAAYGQAGMAARITADTVGLIDAQGFSEYFNPVDGGGAGGAAFSWTAAVYLLMR